MLILMINLRVSFQIDLHVLIQFVSCTKHIHLQHDNFRRHGMLNLEKE